MPSKEIQIETKENEIVSMKYEVLKPGGNDTAVVFGIVEDADLRKRINNSIMKANPNVEQVGFLDLSDIKNPVVMMAGGEFCGNFLRSCAYLIFVISNGTITESLIRFKLENRDLLLKAGAKKLNEAWAEIPFEANSVFSNANVNYQVIKLNGITHIVAKLAEDIRLLESIEQKKITLKGLATEFLEKNVLSNLIDENAALGLMFITEKDGRILLEPVVWVGKMTFFYETACGSGTAAVALTEAQRQQKSVSVSVYQPTGFPITAETIYENGVAVSTQISGYVKRLSAERKILVS